MPSKKKAVPPATEGMQVGTIKEIRQRLADFVEVKFDGNWSYFAGVIGVPLATVEEWKPAKRGVPRLKSLRLLAQHRLSLDWLVVGQGSMEWEPIIAKTDVGALLLQLRPILQRLSGVGELTAAEAFGALLIKFGNEDVLRRAAAGLMPDYTEIVRDLRRRDERTEMNSWVLERLATLDREAAGRNERNVRAVVRELMEKIEKLVPKYIADGDEKIAQLRADALIAQRQLARARRKRWHDSAFTTAAEVTVAVQDARAELKEIAKQGRQPDKAMTERLGIIAAILGQLGLRVEALQRTPETGPSSAQARSPRRPAKRPLKRKRYKPRAGKE